MLKKASYNRIKTQRSKQDKERADMSTEAYTEVRDRDITQARRTEGDSLTQYCAAYMRFNPAFAYEICS